MSSTPQPVAIDTDRLWEILLELLAIPSPTGHTDQVVRATVEILRSMEIECELTRRGAIRATIPGKQNDLKRAVVAHLDTTGAMVRALKDDGRLALAPVGTWSSRFAEGARVSILSEHDVLRGTVLPLKASGHVYGDEIDTQPVSWDNVEVRVDERVSSRDDLLARGVSIGDFVAFDPAPEVTEAGFVAARHLDDKAGVAAVLAAIQGLLASGITPSTSSYVLFTISEEVGSGASAVLHGDIAELVSIDNATPAPEQGSTEFGVTIAAMDGSGPFDLHLTHHLVDLARRHDVPYARDVFRNYRCDAASALEAGNDLRTALLCFGADASHGYERTHVDSLVAVAQLVSLYFQSPPVVARDRRALAPIDGFPDQSIETPAAAPLVASPLPRKGVGES